MLSCGAQLVTRCPSYRRNLLVDLTMPDDRTLKNIGVNDRDLAARLNSLKHRFEDIQLYPDVLPAFATLRNRYPARPGLERKQLSGALRPRRSIRVRRVCSRGRA